MCHIHHLVSVREERWVRLLFVVGNQRHNLSSLFRSGFGSIQGLNELSMIIRNYNYMKLLMNVRDSWWWLMCLKYTRDDCPLFCGHWLWFYSDGNVGSKATTSDRTSLYVPSNLYNPTSSLAPMMSTHGMLFYSSDMSIEVRFLWRLSVPSSINNCFPYCWTTMFTKREELMYTPARIYWYAPPTTHVPANNTQRAFYSIQHQRKNNKNHHHGQIRIENRCVVVGSERK